MLIYAIDVSKEHLDIFSNSLDNKPFRKRIKNNLSAIAKFLTKLSNNDIICAEYTGVYSDLLVHIANCSNIKIALVEGYTIKHSMGNPKGKSDLLDSERIWEYANRFFDKLTFNSFDDELMAELKKLFNLRNQIAKALKTLQAAHSSAKNNVASSLIEHQLRVDSEVFLKQKIKELEKQLMDLILGDSELQKNFELATSITGIGPITAIELIINTGNFKRINSPRKAAAYAGICPYPNQSGNIAKKQRVHFRANKRLKSLLHICAKTVCIHNKEFRLYRERKMMEGKQFYLVMNNVSNKLLRTVYAVIKSGKPFDPNFIQLDPRNNSEIL